MPALDLVANVVVSGILTGLVYGLMALGLSVIFGVVRVVNFAHGEMMTIAMYAATVLFAALKLDPFVAMLPVAAAFFVFGYALQAGLINPFITRPEHSQFMLLVAVAIILVNAMLMAFGPDARNVQVDYQLESYELGPILVDKARLFAAVAAVIAAAGLFAFFRYTLTGKAIRACADNYLGAKVVGLNVKHLYALTFGLGAMCVAIAGCAMVVLVDVTPALGPAYTLLAFVIVIVGGLGSMGGALLGALPFMVGNYALSVVTLILYFAYTGQAWNVMMGFAGQLSLGHALYVGVGAYAAGALFVHFGIGPWAGLWLAIVLCVALGLVIGFLAFRFSISGVYFALLTIAFAEFTRIGFDHLNWTGGPGGMFLRVAQRDTWDLLNFRGPPLMYYYAMLALAAGAFALCAWLLRSRAGYYWQAIRENEEAAQALGINSFRWKLLAVAISAAMTAVAGVFFAFYYNNLFPEQIFHISRSIEIILGPVIGGVGTLFGPVLGAAVLTLLSDGITEALGAFGVDIPGVKQVFYGVVLLLVVMFLPHGIWPTLARKFRL